MITQQRVSEYFDSLEYNRDPGRTDVVEHMAMQWADAITDYVDSATAQDVVAVAVMHERINRELELDLPDASEVYDYLVELAVSVA